ncbi:MAG TPA: hypothetical protein DEV93_17580 [Chloroflexi bacterium]|jgi:hypothetical protein|nr:hypothetical protein [Chloroflexota bacterium]HCU11850.1 hypothetical protein [Gemmatimonadota bacterium]
MAAIRRADWTRLWHYLAGALALGAIATALAYAAIISFTAIFNLEETDALKTAQHVGYTVLALGIAGAFLLAAAQGQP